MAHKPMVGGAVYEIDKGKDLVGGTAYSIDKGKTLVGGTAYEIGFLSLPPLNECTPAQIQEGARSGQAPNFWSVGDTIGIALKGTVGLRTFSDETYYAFIIGFDHNSGIEGNNTIHFQAGKTSAGVDIAFCDSVYNKTGSEGAFRMNTSSTNSGGWASCHMRNTICQAFLSAMPTAWQYVIAPCTKYTDNTGGSNVSANVTATSDKIWLLAEYEALGDFMYSNLYERNYQKQYDYYKNGNGYVKYKDNDLTACLWWFRSASSRNAVGFCTMTMGGDASHVASYYSRGFTPCFMVA